MNLKRIYEYSYDYLKRESQEYITEKQLKDFIYNPDKNKDVTTKIEAYKLLLLILQDYNRFPKTIKYMERTEEIKEVLNNYDLDYISMLDPYALLEAFRKKFAFEKDWLWLRYSKGVISGAKFINSFSDDLEFKNTFNYFNDNDMTREAFALLISEKISNLGFATACNWLKELGYTQYAKPDTHTKAVCEALKLTTDNSDIACYEAMVKVAKDSGVSAFTVDKVWWLICSGNLHRYEIQMKNPGRRKTDFINSLKKEFNV